MVKLIVADLDGTLLDDKKILPEDFGQLLDALNKRGILFTTGSGRTYVTQKTHFAAYCDKMGFICDNGAYIVENGVNTFVSAMVEEDWRRVARLLETRLPEAVTVLCGIKGTYSRDYRGSGAAEDVMAVTYAGVTFVDSLTNVHDNIFKISVCYPYTAKETVFPLLSEHCTGRIKALHTDPSFVDVMNTEVSKGGAVAFLQKKHGISRGETMVFGDYYNDIEMLDQADLSYIMSNAPEDMRKHGRFLAPANNDRGVTAVIWDYLRTN